MNEGMAGRGMVGTAGRFLRFMLVSSPTLLSPLLLRLSLGESGRAKEDRVADEKVDEWRLTRSWLNAFPSTSTADEPFLRCRTVLVLWSSLDRCSGAWEISLSSSLRRSLILLARWRMSSNTPTKESFFRPLFSSDAKNGTIKLPDGGDEDDGDDDCGDEQGDDMVMMLDLGEFDADDDHSGTAGADAVRKDEPAE
jgi:hypothetical protein